jgi:DNA modification methylase
LTDRITLHPGDCLDVLAAMADASVDSCVTDPPYHLTSIVKRFGASDAAPAKSGKTGAYARASRGFMGKQWDGGDVAFRNEVWTHVLRVLKPGGHLLAFSGTRTYHRMACAIEDAGFEIRDQIGWAYGSGFPKSHDVSKGIDRAAGAECEVIGQAKRTGKEHGTYGAMAGDNLITIPATDAAREWQGWGTALKPSFEPVCWAQKPFNNQQTITIIGSTILNLWGRLWSMLPASAAAQLSELSPSEYGADQSDFVQWTADDAFNTRDDLSALMGTLQFELALISSLNTVSSWSATLAAALTDANTFTIETVSSTTIDLRTLKFSLLKITPASIIQAHKSGAWLNADASHAERYLSAAVTKLRAIRELSALGSALRNPPTCSLDATDRIAPNWEPIVLARKPLIGTVAENVLKHGTGALNIDGCRVEALEGLTSGGAPSGANNPCFMSKDADPRTERGNGHASGRWPANIVHDGSEEVVGAFPDSAGQQGDIRGTEPSVPAKGDVVYGFRDRVPFEKRDGGGSAARFFYTAKADADDRLGSKHPTVKPLDLMQWLVRLVTPPGGTVLDPFAGTGTTGEAAFREGFRAVLIEREPEYQNDIRRRMSLVLGGPDERKREGIKASGKTADAGPLFGGGL